MLPFALIKLFFVIYLLFIFSLSGVGSFFIGASFIEPWRLHSQSFRLEINFWTRLFNCLKTMCFGFLIYAFTQWLGWSLLDPAYPYQNSNNDNVSLLVGLPLVIGYLSGVTACTRGWYRIYYNR